MYHGRNPVLKLSMDSKKEEEEKEWKKKKKK